MWNSTIAGSFAGDNIFTEIPNFTSSSAEYLNKCKIRYCPSIPLFNDTEQMMTGYFKLCGLDPKKATTRNTCIFYRMDRPMSRIEEGATPALALTFAFIGLVIIIFVLFILFLDFAVLRRVVNLSKSIRKQTVQGHEALKGISEKAAKKETSKNKKGKSSGNSRHSDSSGGAAAQAPSVSDFNDNDVSSIIWPLSASFAEPVIFEAMTTTTLQRTASQAPMSAVAGSSAAMQLTKTTTKNKWKELM